MSQFKIGDRVRVRQSDEPGWKPSVTTTWCPVKAKRVNTVGKVKFVDSDGDVAVDFGDEWQYFDPSWLAPADEPKPIPPEVVTDTATAEKLDLRSELAFKLLKEAVKIAPARPYDGMVEDAFALADAFLEVARKTSVPGGAS